MTNNNIKRAAETCETEEVAGYAQKHHRKRRICSYIEVCSFILNECQVLYCYCKPTPVTDLYAVFKAYCIKNGLPRVTEETFSTILSNLEYDVCEDEESGVLVCRDLAIVALEDLGFFYDFSDEPVGEAIAKADNNYFVSECTFFEITEPWFGGMDCIEYFDSIPD